MTDASLQEIEIAQFRAANLSAMEIAARCRVNTVDVYAVLSLPRVKAMVTELRADLLRPTLDLARTQVTASVRYLAEVRDDDSVTPANRIKAAITLMGWHKDVEAQVEILPRLASLEASMTDQRPPDNARDDDTVIEHRALVPAGLVADDE